MNASPPSLDLRVRRTYKLLWEALISFMTERDFESVTVTEICERAMVHRTTFYKHFEDKYGLLAYGVEDQLDRLFEEVDSHTDRSVEMVNKADVTPHLVILFNHIFDHKAFYHLMLCGNGTGGFNPRFSKVLTKRFMTRPPASFVGKEQHDSARVALHIQTHVGALLGSITWWLENDCPYTPGEMAQYLWEDAFSRSASRLHGK